MSFSMSIGPFQFIRNIAKGGMGEVILAKDPLFQREVAIKKIRSDLKKEEALKKRFLREAKITAELTHPGVISIYSLHQEGDEIYYAMPYIEGKTLKEILRKAPVPGIGALLPIFKSICQTVAYAHSKKIIHRDLKPENMLIGNFGEVIILDWGLAKIVSEKEEELPEFPEEVGLTNKGKIVGTLAYMAPERALGQEASFQSDIYALGVILYQLLTLRLPFQRTTAKEYRKNHQHEVLIDPEEMAPYRDVPPRLTAIVKKCLAKHIDQRYQSMEELLEDLLSHMEGRIKWFESKKLNVEKNKDWEFKENILLSKNLAISPGIEATDWVTAMISRASFAENIRLETTFTLHESGSGIGFLLNVPEPAWREHPLDGYCLWIGGEEEKTATLFRNRALVIQIPDLYLTKNKTHKIVIENIENKIHVFLDDKQKFTYLSYLPLLGTHIGILYRDFNFKMGEIVVSLGSPMLHLSCLAIPDAFLACRDYKKALAEYRRIGCTFPGQAEGREALFRAGITLLEQGKNARNEKKSKEFYSLALEEFATLHTTPAAPLEYLGKSLVYQAMKESSEEIKCLEFALRRYHKHPLVHAIEEEILYRMQESAQKDRKSAYELILIALRHIPYAYESEDINRLFKHLINHWEPLPFLENPIDPSTMGNEKTALERKGNEIAFAIPLGFWLANPIVLADIFEDILKNTPEDYAQMGNVLYALCELGDVQLAKQSFLKIPNFPYAEVFQPIFLCSEKGLDAAIDSFKAWQKNEMDVRETATFLYLISWALFKERRFEKVELLTTLISHIPLSFEDKILIDAYRIWAFLLQDDLEKAGQLLENYPLELLNHEATLLHPLFGSYLRATEGEEIALAYLSGVIDTPFPRSFALLGHELTNGILENPLWFNTAFLWERRHLYRQLALYYHMAEKPDLENFYLQKERGEYFS